MSLSKNEKDKLLIHKKHHSKKHMDFMKKRMVRGLSFSKAHREALKIKGVQVAKQKFTSFTPRDKPPKRRGVHKKSLSKGEKLQKKLTRYKGQGR